MERIGELAAIATVMCWTTGALFFERGIKHIGVLTVNFIKVVIAFLLLMITSTVFHGMPLPLDATLHNWIFLSLSGFVGFVITDMFLFSAYNTVGPRIAMLFMAFSPPLTAGIAFLFLGESLGQRGLLGMSLVITGIILAIVGRSGNGNFGSLDFLKIKKEDRRGYLFSFLASLGQSIAIVLSRVGIQDYNAIGGTQIRLFTAIIGFGLISLIMYRGKNLKDAAKNPAGLKYTSIGSIFGPFLGVTLSLIAIQQTSVGIASTIFGLTPIMIIVPELLILKKRIKPLEIVGAVVAVCGTAMFFL